MTADSISSEVTRARSAENALSSQIQQTAESISLSVTNSSSSSTIKLMLGQTELSSKTIQMTGLVKFTDLGQEGYSSINGSNIITGTIDAARVNVTHINADNITSGTISADRIEGGKLRISDESRSTKAILVRKSGNDYITIDADDGIIVGRGSVSTRISSSGITVGTYGSWSDVTISSGTISIGSNITITGGTTGRVSCKALTVNGTGYSGQYVTNVRNGGSLPGLSEVKAFDIDSSTNLYAVVASSAPSMRGNSSNGYNFSSNPSWKKIALKQVSYSTKIYGFTGGSLSIGNKTVLAN